MTGAQFIAAAARRMKRAGLFFGHGTDNALDEAAWLVAHVLRVRPGGAAFEARLGRPLPAATLARATDLLTSRIDTRKPLAYLLGEAWFAGLRFHVDERVLVPRSLTSEFILDRFQPWIEPRRVRRILDLCTGSGCMGIACARAFPKARVDCADLSPEALAVARINIRRHRLGSRVRAIHSDLFSALGHRRYDVIVTNPPYVSRATMRRLPMEYRREPALALESGRDGLDCLRRILTEAPHHLAPGGILIAETGESEHRVRRAFSRLPQRGEPRVGLRPARRGDSPPLNLVWLEDATGDTSTLLLTDALAGA